MKSLLSMVFGLVLVGLVAGNAQALDLSLGPHYDGIEDYTGWVTGFHSDSVAQAATGLCSGTLVKVQNKGKLFAGLLSPCILGATTFEAGDEQQTDLLAGFKVLEIMKVNGGIFYAPTRTEPRGDWYDNLLYGFGITLVGVGEAVFN